jgi:hypothetical protein
MVQQAQVYFSLRMTRIVPGQGHRIVIQGFNIGFEGTIATVANLSDFITPW